MTRQPLPDDTRGLAVGIVVFFAILVASALLWALLDEAAIMAFESTSNMAETTTGSTQITDARDLWEYILYFPVLLGVTFLVARAVTESRRP